MPKTKLGKWSVGLSILFIIIIGVSLILVLALKVLSFNDHWWDATVPIAGLIELIALYTGLRALIKYKDRSAWVYFSVGLGIAAILFALLHSLFISD